MAAGGGRRRASPFREVLPSWSRRVQLKSAPVLPRCVSMNQCGKPIKRGFAAFNKDASACPSSSSNTRMFNYWFLPALTLTLYRHALWSADKLPDRWGFWKLTRKPDRAGAVSGNAVLTGSTSRLPTTRVERRGVLSRPGRAPYRANGNSRPLQKTGRQGGGGGAIP
jgi:hypothetical protein